MANRLVRLTPVSAATSTPDAGASFNQVNTLPINGLTNGSGVCIDHSETLYVSDATKHVIYKYRKGDSVSHIFAGAYGTSGLADGQAGAARFNAPAGLAVDASGNVYVVDTGNSRIRKIDQNGNVFTVAAIPAGGTGPGGIAIDATGNIYYMDRH